MISRLSDEIGLLQAKSAAKLTGTFCGIVQAFRTGWHFPTYVPVSTPISSQPLVTMSTTEQ